LPSGFSDQHVMNTYAKNWFKYGMGFVVCLLIRLIPFRPPNIEPILATQMPFAKAYGGLAGFTFAFASMILFDLISGRVGLWTFITAGAYGLLGLWAALYFKNKENKSWNYVKFAIMGTLAFDIVTGLSVGPLFFGQPFMEALIGQIPFTFMHLLGNIGFAALLSPLLYSFVISNQKLETASIVSVFMRKNA
jgi:uncharacterized membrane protein